MPIDPASPSATVPDWSREEKSAFEWAPSRSLLASLRSYQSLEGAGSIGLATNENRGFTPSFLVHHNRM